MDPAELRQHLAQYADGELDPTTAQEVERLMASDPEARAEVERWRALRQSAGRVLTNTAVPARLETRIRAGIRARRGSAGPRLLRFGAPGLAVAAVVLLAFTFWPRGASATAVEACDFARIYRNCAMHGHDTLGVNGGPTRKTVAQLRNENPHAGEIPDLSVAGYELVGACTCPPAPNVRVVHAYFRHCAEGNIVSSFSIACQIHLCNQGQPCKCACQDNHVYRCANDGPVTLICWSECGHSYVLACGKLTREQLVELAEKMRHHTPDQDSPAALAVSPE